MLAKVVLDSWTVNTCSQGLCFRLSITICCAGADDFFLVLRISVYYFAAVAILGPMIQVLMSNCSRLRLYKALQTLLKYNLSMYVFLSACVFPP